MGQLCFGAPLLLFPLCPPGAANVPAAGTGRQGRAGHGPRDPQTGAAGKPQVASAGLRSAPCTRFAQGTKSAFRRQALPATGASLVHPGDGPETARLASQYEDLWLLLL